MKVEELIVGEPYVVAGRGEMLLAEIDTSFRATSANLGAPTIPVCRMLEHGRGDYWCYPEKLVRKATKDDIRARDEQARARNVDCNNPDCWCVKYRAKGGKP